MITPRLIRLLRVPDLQTLHGLLARQIAEGDPLAPRARAVLVPTRGAAESLRRTLENRLLGDRRVAAVLPDLLTRGDFYDRLHQHLTQAPPLLSEFEREVLIRRAARVASETGAAAPFRLRAGLIVEILALYDELRRRGRSIADFDRLLTGSLEPVADTDRGAERMLRQTRFLSAVYDEFERRVAATGRLDEHALRAQLLAAPAGPYRHVVVSVADQAADAMGLWPADFDLLARLPGLEQVDVVATEPVLASGLHQRLHDAFPGLDEVRVEGSASLPVLLAPEIGPAQTDVRWFVSRDREEELSDIARGVKCAAVSERTGVTFQRPLPYLYLARSVFADAEVPYQALDALPLAAEPLAAALDLVFEVAMTEASRAPLVDLLGSPHWGFTGHAPAAGAQRSSAAVGAAEASALDALLREVKYLGGWERLDGLIAESGAGAGKRAGRLWRRAEGALRAAAMAAREIREAFDAPSASGQVRRLVAFIRAHERLPEESSASHAGHVRARGAVLGALAALADAHAAHDDEPLLANDLANTVRRWIEGQTFSPRTGSAGIALLDARAAAYADVDDLRLVGLVDTDWPERSRRSIFYPFSLLAPLGWPNEIDRLTAARARFFDLLRLPKRQVSISTFTLEDDAIVAPSAFVEELDVCGLPVERVMPGIGPRVFIQEALREAPFEPAAARGLQAEWLAVRAGRTIGTDPAYHGEAGARAPAAYAVSHVERYLDCPFKYYSSYVLGLEEERNEDAGLSPRERGQFLHEIFQQFFVRWQQAGRTSITGETLRPALALFEEVVDANLAPLSDAERALERTYLLGSAAAPGLAERAFAFEIEQGVGVRERLLEHVLEGAFVFATESGPRTLQIHGKADRIDLLEDGTIRIVDYKLGRAPKPARALQLPVYGVCASQQLDGRHGRSWPLSRAGYLAFKEKNAFVALGNTPAATQQALDEGQRRMVAAVDGIERGQFPVDPDEPFFCTRCGYAGVCRKDYVGDE